MTHGVMEPPLRGRRYDIPEPLADGVAIRGPLRHNPRVVVYNGATCGRKPNPRECRHKLSLT